MTLGGIIPLITDHWNALGQTVTVTFGPLVKSFTLNAKGATDTKLDKNNVLKLLTPLLKFMFRMAEYQLA